VRNFLAWNCRPQQRALVEDFFYTKLENDRPAYTEAVIIAGMRSGKSAGAATSVTI
jgi:hypothetical protein